MHSLTIHFSVLNLDAQCPLLKCRFILGNENETSISHNLFPQNRLIVRSALPIPYLCARLDCDPSVYISPNSWQCSRADASFHMFFSSWTTTLATPRQDLQQHVISLTNQIQMHQILAIATAIFSIFLIVGITL